MNLTIQDSWFYKYQKNPILLKSSLRKYDGSLEPIIAKAIHRLASSNGKTQMDQDWLW